MPLTPDLSFTKLDEFVNDPVVDYCKAMSSEEEPKIVKKNDDAPIIEEWVSDDEEEDVSQPKIEKRIVSPSIVKNEFVKSKQQQKTTRKTIKQGNLQMDLQDQGVIDSGCSRHIIRNIVDLKNIALKGGLSCLFAKATSDESKLWHRRLGHLNFKTMNKLVKGNLVRGLPSKLFENDQTCIACQKGKQHRASTTKDETSGILKSFITGIENLVDHKVKVIRCDNGTEFKNKEMNLTLIEATRTMLADFRLPTTFRQKQLILLAMCPVTILNTIDHLGKFDGKADESFFVGYSLNSKAFRVFNSRPRIVEENLHIRINESTPNVVGSGPDWLFDIDALTRTINYKPIVADPKSSHNDGSKPSSDDGKKVDKDPRKDSECNDQEKEDNVNRTNNVNAAGTNEVNAIGGKISIKLLFDPNMPALEDYSIFDFSRNDEDDGSEADMNNLDTTIQVSPNPTTRIHKDHPLDQVIGNLQSATQIRKMLKNLEEHGKNPKRAIGTKWVFRNKKDERGIVIRNKARLVAQGYTQEKEIDYDEVFAPVARIEAIRLFLAYASFKDFVVYQMDVKSAFLYGKIEEEVYVCQPPGFEDPDFPDRVYKVEKALYGLHQAPRAWYETLSTYLLDNGFQRGKIDKTLFIKRHKGDILLVQVYVDDIIFGSTKKELCIAFEKLMHEKFQMSSMGELTFFLGLQVQQKKDGIFISQDKYVDEILKKFRFTEVKTASTPMETQKPLLKDKDGEEVDVHMYRSMIGSLMYLTSSRPDIMFTVCACARYQVNPKVSHLYAVKRIFRYLKGQPKLGLWYPKDSPFDLVAYTNSNYAGVSLDRKSTTRGCQFLGYRLISWQCKKQTVIANYTIEAEYLAASSCYGQVLWIQNQLLDAGDTKPRKPKRKDTQVPQPSDPSENVVDEAVHKELGDSLVRAATTASSLKAEQDSGNITKTQSKETPNESSSLGTTSSGGPRCQETLGDTIAQTSFENVSTHSNDLLLARGNTLRSDEDRLKLDELMALCNTLQNMVLDLEKIKTTQQKMMEEPKRVIHALKDPSWIEAMQEELLQFKNKKDERGIVIRNKERLVAQGYTQEGGTVYDEVFATVARIEAIRLFLAYASFKDFEVFRRYSDASWITNSKDHTSTTSWVFLLGGCAISWASKKQTCITDSTMEADFVALVAAGKEAEWLRNLIYEILL
ncbi:putative ribonuclease H-like domain-containing protein [Tanacetum coccineum]